MRKILLVLTLSLLLFVSCQPEVDLSGANNAQVHIVAVALDYRNAFLEDTSMFGSSGILKGTVYDTVELAYCLSDIYNETGIKHDVHYMVAYGASASEKFTDNYPSADNILRTIKDLRTSPQDLVIFIFAGHADAPYNEEAFFCAGKVEDGEIYSKLLMKDVYGALEEKNCSCIAILDTCYAGSLLSWDQTQQYMDQAVTKFLNQDEFSNISILASSQAYETSHYELEKYNAQSQEHGYFTLGLLDVLGWNHDINGDHKRFLCTGDSGVAINGYVEKVPKSMTVEDLYKGVKDRWSDLTAQATAGAKYQEPTRSFTHSLFVPIPYGGMSVPQQCGKQFNKDVVAIVNGKGYTDVQEAVNAVTEDGEPGAIYIIAPVTTDHVNTDKHILHINTKTKRRVDFNFGPYTFLPRIYAEGGGDVYIHGKTEDEIGYNIFSFEKTHVYFDDVQREEFHTQFGIVIVLPDPHLMAGK